MVPESDSYERRYAELEKLWASPSFGDVQRKLQAMLVRAPEQLLHTRGTLLNGQPCTAALRARDVLELVPGNVVTARTAVWYCALVQDAARAHRAWHQHALVVAPDAFARWRARKDAADAAAALGAADLYAPGTVVLVPVCESTQRWSLLLALPARDADGRARVQVLFVDPAARFDPMVLADCTALLRACHTARGCPDAPLVVTKHVPLPAAAAHPAPCDAAVAVLALVRAVVARETMGVPTRLIPAFRLHPIRELLKNSLIPLH